MKNYFVTLIIFLIPFFGCNKSTNTNNPPDNGQSDGWQLGTVSYTTSFTSRMSLNYGTVRYIKIIDAFGQVTGSGGNASHEFAVWFAEYPTTPKDYSIVEVPNLTVKGLAADECAVRLTGPASPSSYDFGTANGITESGKKAYVTVTGGKVKIIIPQITLKNSTSTSPPSEVFVGTLVER